MDAAGEGNWYGHFFRGLWLDVQRAAWDPEATRTEVDALERWLRLDPGRRILDVPCGTGRHAVEFARRGHRVVGLDLTPEFVADARRAAAAVEGRCEFHVGDMRTIDRFGPADVVTCLWGSFGYLGDEGDTDFLAACARALRPGGRLALDTHVAETLLPRLAEEAVGERTVAGIRVHSVASYDPWRAVTVTRWTLTREGDTFTDTTEIRLYTAYELARMLASCGFEIEASAGGLDGRPFEVGAERLHVVARRLGS
ncbi:MAG: class I SAM-dependent methyltransferase [Deltaproteobacteria bacterium]|nr:MAG: class I SAM-dependent methyltransferase [Deltaproteobacteria bacterium]